MERKGLITEKTLLISIIVVAFLILLILGLSFIVKVGSESDSELDDGGSETELEQETACSNELDDDGDGWVDLADFGCVNSEDDSELNDGDTACSDGVDNDGDEMIDQADSGCFDARDKSEKLSSGGSGGSGSGSGRGNNNPPDPFCGDGNLDVGEECDDGNTNNGDGCSSLCNIEFFVEIEFPVDGASYNYNNSISLNYSVITRVGQTLDSCWYVLDNDEPVVMPNCVNTEFDASEGYHVMSVFANDTNNETISDSVSFSINITAPSVSLVSPDDGAYVDAGYIDFVYFPEDEILDSCELWGDFSGTYGKELTDINSVDGQNNNLTLAVTQGTYLWAVSCNNTAGGVALTDNRTIHVDINRPPELAPIGDLVVDEGESLGFNLQYNDSDGDSVSCLDAQNLPAGAGFDTVLCEFSWVPDFTQSGVYPGVVFTIEDDGNPVLQDSETITISVNDVVGGCNQDADCDDGLFCNGAEQCVDNVCQPGADIIDDGVSCTIDNCDEDLNSVTHLPDDSFCQDGLWCNGAEFCDAVLDCQAGTPQVCNDGISCTVDSCDEGGDLGDNIGQCDFDSSSCQCQIDADCDDGNACTVNTCVNFQCQTANEPDGTSCDDGAFCSVNDQCTAGVCGGSVRECGDGVSCTQDTCDEANDQCVSLPHDALCDNGLFCDGSEFCDVILDCQPGTPPDCSDPYACTQDICNEGSDMCENPPDNSICLPGYCDPLSGDADANGCVECQLSNAFWSVSQSTEGDTVTLSVEGVNCAGTVVSIELWDDDGLLPDDYIEDLSDITMADTSGTLDWVVEYNPDTDGLTEEPEYYFKAIFDGLSGLQTIDSGIMDVSPLIAQCENGVDDDGDGWVDLADPGCADANDNDESNSDLGHCADGADNDADSFIDGNDPECATWDDAEGESQCSNGIDDDLDGFIDLTDGACTSSDDDTEEAQFFVSFPGWDPGDGYVKGLTGDLTAQITGDTQVIDSVLFQTWSDSAGAVQGIDTNNPAPGPYVYEAGNLEQVSDGNAEVQVIVRELDSGGGYNNQQFGFQTVFSSTACNDGVDNDADGSIDFPDDFGCDSLTDDDETNNGATECSNGDDDDSDTFVDQDDPDCSDRNDDDESSPAGQATLLWFEDWELGVGDYSRWTGGTYDAGWGGGVCHDNYNVNNPTEGSVSTTHAHYSEITCNPGTGSVIRGYGGVEFRGDVFQSSFGANVDDQGIDAPNGVVVTFWHKLDSESAPFSGAWLSPFTVTDDCSNNWNEVITLGLDEPLNVLRTVHTGPVTYFPDWSNAPAFPLDDWTRVTVYVNYYTEKIHVWQNGVRVSEASFTRTNNDICQFHWGAYATQSIGNGNALTTLYEDNLRIFKLNQPWTDFAVEPWFDISTGGLISSVCGNSITETEEQCDDGNTVSGDGCSQACILEPASVCGDGQITGGEVCEPSDLNGETCVSQGFDGGNLACALDCLSFDTSGCFNAGSECSDSVDNDGDGWIDGQDYGCTQGITEDLAGTTECSNQQDDADPEDFLMDGNDPGCLTWSDDDETDPNGSFDTFITSSRTSGITPLSVNFDAIGNLNWNEIDALDFAWDFGDGNTFLGYLAAHVYENPGSYDVTLTVRDLQGNMEQFSETINVNDADAHYTGTNTVCFANDNGWTGCPPGALQQIGNDFDALTNAHKGDDKRLLYRRGDTFSNDAVISFSGIQGITIGDFGNSAHAKPIILTAGDMFKAFSGGPANARYLNLDVRATGDNLLPLIHTNTHYPHILVYGVEITDMGYLIDNADFDNVVVKDSKFHSLQRYGSFLGQSDNIAFLNTEIEMDQVAVPDGTNGCSGASCAPEHGIRTQGGRNLLFNNMVITNVKDIKTDLSIRGSSEYVLVSDSIFEGVTTVEPQNAQSAENQRYVIFERNFYQEDTAGRNAFEVSANDVTFRNNVILGAGRPEMISIVNHANSGTARTRGIKVYHNSVVDARPFKVGTARADGVPLREIEIKNNAHYEVSLSAVELGIHPYKKLYIGGDVDLIDFSEFDIDGNVYFVGNDPAGDTFWTDYAATWSDWLNLGGHGFDANGYYQDPEFVDAANGDLRLQATSVGIDNAIPRTLRDYEGNLRPLGAGHDIGAYEFDTGLSPESEEPENPLAGLGEKINEFVVKLFSGSINGRAIDAIEDKPGITGNVIGENASEQNKIFSIVVVAMILAFLIGSLIRKRYIHFRDL